MCTVVIEVAGASGALGASALQVDARSSIDRHGASARARDASASNTPSVSNTRVLAVRDEDPGRAWDAPGAWWPEYPGVIGVRDRRAGGAWLAMNPETGRLAVLLNRPPSDGQRHQSHGAPHSGVGSGVNASRAVNRAPEPSTLAATSAARPSSQGPGAPLASRGTLPLTSVTGGVMADPPTTAPFSLVEVTPTGASLTTWDGVSLRRQAIEPGVHMIAHHELDDVAQSPRIAAWLPEFQALTGIGDAAWRDAWVGLLAKTAALGPNDDRAIVRDNRVHNYPTASLLACLAEVRAGLPTVTLEHAVFDEPGVWGEPVFVRDL